MQSQEIRVLTAKGEEIEVSKSQALRFMGVRIKDADEQILKLCEVCLEDLRESLKFKACFRKSEISFEGEDTTVFEFGKVKSKALRKNLESCKSAYVFAASCGIDTDRYIMRQRKLSEGKGVMTDCLGSSAVECWCDEVNRIISKGKVTKPRFSPGYGGVSLEVQKDVLSFLDAQKKIGITLTDSLMMVPTKSVTAFIGVVEE